MSTSDPFDLSVLRALRNPPRTARLADRIAEHLANHDGYVAFSGGKDSTVVLDLARQIDPAIPVVFFDSGLEYPETYDYIARMADCWNLSLDVQACEPDMLTLLHNAGTWDHTVPTLMQRERMRTHLIEVPAAAAHVRHGDGELWGVRADESAVRRRFYGRILAREIAQSCSTCCTGRAAQIDRHGGISRRADGTVAYGPIWRWSTDQVWEYAARESIPLNPVYQRLRELGAPERALRVTPMVDAGMLATGRLTWLRRGWPDLSEQLMTVLPRMREFV